MITVNEHPMNVSHWICKNYLTMLLLAFLLAGLLATSLTAEPAASSIGVGVAFAPIGGHGFSFRKLPQSGFGYQCGTIFWKNSENSYFNLGGELLYVLRHTRLTAFYVPVGISFTYDNQLLYRNEPPYNEQYRDRSKYISGGAGIGFTGRFESWEDIWFSLDLAMVADKSYLGPLPQFAIHYFFR